MDYENCELLDMAESIIRVNKLLKCKKVIDRESYLTNIMRDMVNKVAEDLLETGEHIYADDYESMRDILRDDA